MTEKNEENNPDFVGSSKFMKTFLVIVAALLIFAGPTYFVYLLLKINLSYAASMISGIVVLVLGLALMAYLVRKNVIT
jgi:hypothetical protein